MQKETNGKMERIREQVKRKDKRNIGVAKGRM